MDDEVQAVVLAGGKGRRIGAVDMPKVLIPFLGRPMILPILETLEKLNCEPEICIVTGFEGEKVVQVLGAQYIYAHQTEQLGTGHALMAAIPNIHKDHVLTLYGDMPFISSQSLDSLVATHLLNNADLTLITSDPKSFANEFSSLYSYGRIIRDENGKVSKIVEVKDATEAQRLSTEINPGYYVFKTSWLKKNISKLQNTNAQKEYYLTDLLGIAVEDGAKVADVSAPPLELLGINTLEDLKIAEGFGIIS